MATISIRGLPDDVHRRLRVRAAKAGRSMEAEARAILETATADQAEQGTADVQDWIDALYGAAKPSRVVESLIRERRDAAKRE